jgi:transposase-like protein
MADDPPKNSENPGCLGRQLPKVEQLMRAAPEDLLAFAAFPQLRWRSVWPTKPVEQGPGK